MRREFHLDLNLTDQCNMRCAYCIEMGHHESNTCDAIIPKLYQWIDRFLESSFFKSSYDTLQLAFWGGEPTLEWATICGLVDRYVNDRRVSFMMYTNGYYLPDALKQLIIKSNENFRREPQKYTQFIFQISYDGQPVHDLCRRTVFGKPTAKQVLKTIQWAQDFGVPFDLKSTITVDLLEYIYDAWKDVNEVSRGKCSYFPTVDYFNPLDPDLEKGLDVYLEEMKTGMKKIAAALLVAQAEGKRVSSFKWFEPSRNACKAGQSLFGLDVDGKIYSCHSALYSPAKPDHLVGTLDDDFSIFEVAADRHTGLKPEECRTCEAVFCTACNVNRYRFSQKESYIDRWTDYPSVSASCRIYREISKVTRAFIQMRDAA